jgi:hypothetical protein
MDIIRPITDSELSNVMLIDYYILWEVKGNMLYFKNSLTGKELVYDNNELKLKEVNVNGLYLIQSK